MLELLAFARLSELSGRKDKEHCRRDEDAFYEEFGADPPALVVAIGGALSFFVVAGQRDTRGRRLIASRKGTVDLLLRMGVTRLSCPKQADRRRNSSGENSDGG
jgi:hypothetical protein